MCNGNKQIQYKTYVTYEATFTFFVQKYFYANIIIYQPRATTTQFHFSPISSFKFNPFILHHVAQSVLIQYSGVPRNFVWVAGGSKIQLRSERMGIWER